MSYRFKKILGKSKNNKPIHHRILRQKKQLEEQFKRLQIKEDALWEYQMSSSSAYVIFDINGKIKKANPSFLNLIGKESVIQHHFDSFVTKEFIDMFQQEFTFLVKGGKVPVRMEIQCKYQNETIYLDTEMTNRLEDPTVEGIVFRGVNITETVLGHKQELQLLTDSIEQKESVIRHQSQRLTEQQIIIDQFNNFIVDLKKIANSEKRLDQQKLIESHIRQTANWKHFKEHFDIVFDHFFQKLDKKYPSLTIKEQKHCAYLRMKLSRKEVAMLMGVTVEGVKKARFRVAKKTKVQSVTELRELIENL